MESTNHSKSFSACIKNACLFQENIVQQGTRSPRQSARHGRRRDDLGGGGGQGSRDGGGTEEKAATLALVEG